MMKSISELVIYTRVAVCPGWAIYWTLGKFLKPLEMINLPKSPTFLGDICRCQNLSFL